MEDRGYTNRFVEVHKKAMAWRDQLRRASKSQADRREDRLVQEAEAMVITDKESSSPNSLTLPPSDPA